MAVEELVNKDRNALFRAVVPILFERIREFPGKLVVIAICGGRSVGGVLQAVLQEGFQLAAADWQRLHFFMVDERLVPLDHPDSNFGLVQQLFFAPAVAEGFITEKQIHPFVPDNDTADRGTSRYRAKLSKFGGKFDFVFLGVGEDGHIAGIFPRGVCFQNPPPAEKDGDFVAFDNSPKPPPQRMTATPQLLRKSTFAVGMFFGEDKRDAYNRFRDPAVALEDCPAKLLAEFPHTVVLTDL